MVSSQNLLLFQWPVDNYDFFRGNYNICNFDYFLAPTGNPLRMCLRFGGINHESNYWLVSNFIGFDSNT